MTAALASQGVQYGTVTIANGNTTGTGSINAMGAGGFLLWGGQNPNQAGVVDNQSVCGLSISGGTITATRNTSATSTITANFIAVDGDTTNLIKSINFGTVTLNSGQSTLTATIPSVTTGNTAVAHLGFTTPATTLAINTAWPIWAVASATTISMTTNTSGGSPTGYFCAIEFQGSALTSLQAISDSQAPSGTTRTKTITSVTQGNTFTIFAGCYSSGTAANSGNQYGQITANTTLTIGTSSAPFITIVYNCFIVNLVSGLVETSAQRGLITITTGTSGTAALSPTMIVADTIATYCGNSTNGTNLNAIFSADTLTNSSTVTATTNGSATTSTSWEAIALNPAAAAANPNAWYPVYADQARRNPRPQADFVFQQIPPYVPPPFIPGAIYSDQQRPNRPVQRDFNFNPPWPLNLPMPFQPEFPNQVPFFVQQRVSGMVEPILALNLPMRWQPRYIDLPRPVIQPFRNFFFAPPFPLNFTNAWQPEYPNQVPFFNQQLPSGLVDVPIFPLNFPLPWLPQYTDLPRPYLARQGDFVFNIPYPISTPVTVNSWYPVYPNQTPWFDQQNPSGAVEPVQPLNFQTPWMPELPDQVRPNLKVQRDFVFGPLFALNNPLPWLPTYPDLARKPEPVKGSSVFAPIPALNLPLPWLPTYPDSVRLRLNVQNTNQLFNIQTIIASARFAYWISFDGL